MNVPKYVQPMPWQMCRIILGRFWIKYRCNLQLQPQCIHCVYSSHSTGCRGLKLYLILTIATRLKVNAELKDWTFLTLMLKQVGNIALVRYKSANGLCLYHRCTLFRECLRQSVKCETKNELKLSFCLSYCFLFVLTWQLISQSFPGNVFVNFHFVFH